jgi:hypothetical protein
MSELSGMPYIYREQYKKWAEVKEALREAYKLYPNEPDICGEEIHLTIIKDETKK